MRPIVTAVGSWGNSITSTDSRVIDWSEDPHPIISRVDLLRLGSAGALDEPRLEVDR